MAALSLQSPGAFRLVAASAAMVGSLALVALGVQIGTNGLGTDGPDRGPATATASPAAAVVGVARGRTTPPALQDALAALVPLAPAVGGAGSATTSGVGGTGTGSSSGGDTPPGAGPTSAPAPSPAPNGPAPTPSPVPVPLPAPPPTPVPVPDPVPILDPLAPVLGPVLGGSSTGATGPGLLPTLTGLLGL